MVATLKQIDQRVEAIIKAMGDEVKRTSITRAPDAISEAYAGKNLLNDP